MQKNFNIGEPRMESHDAEVHNEENPKKKRDKKEKDKLAASKR